MTAIVEQTAESVSVSYAAQDPCIDPDLDRAAVELVELREVREALNEWEDVLVTFIADSLGSNIGEVDGVGRLEVRRGRDRKTWDRRDLLRRVLDSRMPPSPDGEVDPTDDGQAEVDGETVSVSQDLGRVMHVWNLGAPRVTALRARGIDPDEFCESTPGKLSVIVT